MAEKYLSEERKDSRDGNNWSVISYKQGMVRRVVSIATPYCGTPWANILLGAATGVETYNKFIGTNFVMKLVLSKLFSSSYYTSLKSALSEIKVNTPATDYVRHNVPTHAIYGDVSHLLDTLGYTADLLGDVAIEAGTVMLATPWPALAPIMYAVGLGGKITSLAESLLSALFYDGHDLIVGVSSASWGFSAW